MSGSSLHIVKFSESSPSRDKCREIVQKILQSELGYNLPPKLSFDELGKPSIEENSKLAFSYAHSPSQLVIAIDSAAQSIGIDTEPMSRNEELCRIADMAFSAKELQSMKNNYFIFKWCLKEAALKRYGTGFRFGNPNEYTVNYNNGLYVLYHEGAILQKGCYANITDGKNITVVCSEGIMSWQQPQYYYLEKGKVDKCRVNESR